MGKYFDDAHALWGSQLLGQPVEVTDSEDVAAARKKASDYESCMVLGKTLSRQLRYREASEAFGRALEFRPDDPDGSFPRCKPNVHGRICCAAKHSAWTSWIWNTAWVFAIILRGRTALRWSTSPHAFR